MASSIIQLTALLLVPVNSLGYCQPITHPKNCRHRDRTVIFSLPSSFDEDILPTKDKIELNGDGALEDDYIDSKPDLNNNNKNILQDESENDDQYPLLLDYRDDLDDGMDMIELNAAEGMDLKPNAELDDAGPIADNFLAVALQTPSESNAEMIRTPQKNPRMQMFAYLSQPSMSFSCLLFVMHA